MDKIFKGLLIIMYDRLIKVEISGFISHVSIEQSSLDCMFLFTQGKFQVYLCKFYVYMYVNRRKFERHGSLKCYHMTRNR